MKPIVRAMVVLVSTATALFAQYSDNRANANAAAARRIAQQALDAVEDLGKGQELQEAEANRKTAATEKEALDREVAEANAANEQKRFDDYRRVQAVSIQGNSPVAPGTGAVPSKEDLAAMYALLVESSFERAFAFYPVFADPEGMQRLALDAYVQRVLTDPTRRPEFADPKWPEKLTKEFAVKMKIAEVPANEPEIPKAPVKPMPETFAVLTLSNGRVLHDVTLKGFLSSAVLVKHQAGIESIAYSAFPSEYQAALEIKRPHQKTAAEDAAALAAIDSDAKRLAGARKDAEESARISKAATRSDEIARESLLAKHIDAARDALELYFNYEYVNGSGPTHVEVRTETPEARPGWTGSYRIRGRAYLAFDYGRAVRKFEVETETVNGEVTARVIHVD